MHEDAKPNRNHRDRDRSADQPPRPEWEKRVGAKGEVERPKSPMIPNDITPEDLEFGVRVQLKTLSAENAEMTARHLAMVGLLLNDDVELAHQHALAAHRRSGRIPVVRETLAITAYYTEDWTLALREFLAFRRATASNEHIGMMVDCERGLGRAQKALELGRSVDRAALTSEARVHLAIAMSGARLDLGQQVEALAELEIKELNPSAVFEYSPELFYAYAETLDILGRAADAAKWNDLAKRAEKAIVEKITGGQEAFEVIEEYQIPEPYARRSEDGDRGPRPPREAGDRKPFRPGGDGKPRDPRAGGGRGGRPGNSPRPGGFGRDGGKRPPRSGGGNRGR